MSKIHLFGTYFIPVTGEPRCVTLSKGKLGSFTTTFRIIKGFFNKIRSAIKCILLHVFILLTTPCLFEICRQFSFTYFFVCPLKNRFSFNNLCIFRPFSTNDCSVQYVSRFRGKMSPPRRGRGIII